MHIVCLFPLPLQRVGIWRNLVSLALHFPAALDYRSTHKAASHPSHVDRMEVSQFILECQMNWCKGNETAQLVGQDTHANPDDLIPRTHTTGEDWLIPASCSLTSTLKLLCTYMHVHTKYIKCLKLKKTDDIYDVFFLKIIYPETKRKGLKVTNIPGRMLLARWLKISTLICCGSTELLSSMCNHRT